MIRCTTGDADEPDIWPLYQAVFGDYPDDGTWRAQAWDRHRARAGFRVTRAFAGQSLVGFAYGYTGGPGQWWTDNARRVLPAPVAEAWLGGHFELVSLGVRPDARRDGAGRALTHALLEGLPHERLLLMTSADAADPARRLYASEGWQVVGPGLTGTTVIMGRLGATR